jgi:hypothetical protein
MNDKKLDFHAVRERARHEAIRFVVLFLYLWIMFMLFQVHQYVILAEHAIPFQNWGFGFVNALLLAKVMIVADDLRFGDWFRSKPLLVPIIVRSIAFAVLFIVIETLEKVLLGVYHGVPASDAVPTFGGGGFKGSFLVGIITAFALLPFFAFDEIERVLGRGTLRDLLVKARTTPPSPASDG